MTVSMQPRRIDTDPARRVEHAGSARETRQRRSDSWHVGAEPEGDVVEEPVVISRERSVVVRSRA